MPKALQFWLTSATAFVYKHFLKGAAHFIVVPQFIGKLTNPFTISYFTSKHTIMLLKVFNLIYPKTKIRGL